MSLTLERVHAAMLAAIDDSYQKTPGFPAWDFTRAFALAVASLDGDVTAAEERQDIENLEGADLDSYVWQLRGMIRKYGTYASAILRVVSGSGTVYAGALFTTASGVDFYAVSDGTYREGDFFPVRAAEPGSAGNVPAGAITQMPVTITGIAMVTNDEAAAGGFDEETDEALRGRYYDDLQHPNNGGNLQAYREWALSVPGVGRVTVVPIAFGLNTVGIWLTDANGDPASDELIAQVQVLIDPNRNGDGSGEAPVGAVCTVLAATALPVDISAEITLADGWEEEVVRPAIQDSLTKTVREAALAGEILRYGRLADAILDTEGVLDYRALTVNGETESIRFDARSAPVLGEVTLVCS